MRQLVIFTKNCIIEEIGMFSSVSKFYHFLSRNILFILSVIPCQRKTLFKTFQTYTLHHLEHHLFKKISFLYGVYIRSWDEQKLKKFPLNKKMRFVQCLQYTRANKTIKNRVKSQKQKSSQNLDSVVDVLAELGSGSMKFLKQ